MWIPGSRFSGHKTNPGLRDVLGNMSRALAICVHLDHRMIVFQKRQGMPVGWRCVCLSLSLFYPLVRHE